MKYVLQEVFYSIFIPIIDLTSPGRPLASANNNDVWKAMLSPDLSFSDHPQCSSLRALHLLIRFYISIEDGECVVERDLGLLKAFSEAHQNMDTALADDLLLLRSDPIDGNEVCVGANGTGELAVGNSLKLGAESRRLATLWREVYGARLGCYRKAGPSERGKRNGN